MVKSCWIKDQGKHIKYFCDDCQHFYLYKGNMFCLCQNIAQICTRNEFDVVDMLFKNRLITQLFSKNLSTKI